MTPHAAIAEAFFSKCQVDLKDIPYIDFPEIKIDEHESTEMPFRYVKDEKGTPIMPLVK